MLNLWAAPRREWMKCTWMREDDSSQDAREHCQTRHACRDGVTVVNRTHADGPTAILMRCAETIDTAAMWATTVSASSDFPEQ